MNGTVTIRPDWPSVVFLVSGPVLAVLLVVVGCICLVTCYCVYYEVRRRWERRQRLKYQMASQKTETELFEIGQLPAPDTIDEFEEELNALCTEAEPKPPPAAPAAPAVLAAPAVPTAPSAPPVPPVPPPSAPAASTAPVSILRAAHAPTQTGVSHDSELP